MHSKNLKLLQSLNLYKENYNGNRGKMLSLFLEI